MYTIKIVNMIYKYNKYIKKIKSLLYLMLYELIENVNVNFILIV